jgi:hypothetical protein
MTLHAKLSASGSHRWLYCPGSVKAEDAMNPPGSTRVSSFYAEEGSAAHELAEISLVRSSGDCSHMIGKPLTEANAFTVTQEMSDYVQVYTDYVRSFRGEHFYEQRVDFSEWVPNGWGTSDAIVIDGDTIRVFDLKYGQGLRVDAEENTQGLLYALGAYSEHELYNDFKKVVIVIVQPRLDHISEWEITIPELLKRGEWISQRANDALEPEPKRIAGESQCTWCLAKAVCPALMQATYDAIVGDFDEMDLTPVNTLTDEQLRKALDAKALIIGWLDAVEGHIKERVEGGKDFAGYKLVNGRSSRRWTDDEQAEVVLTGALKEAAYETKILSVAKAEKVLGKSKLDLLEGLVVRSSGKPTLVKETDPRPSIGVSTDDFDSL